VGEHDDNNNTTTHNNDNGNDDNDNDNDKMNIVKQDILALSPLRQKRGAPSSSRGSSSARCPSSAHPIVFALFVTASLMSFALVFHCLGLLDYGAQYDSDPSLPKEEARSNSIPYYLQQPHLVNLNIEDANFSSRTNQSYIPNVVAFNHPLMQFKLAVNLYWESLRGPDAKKQKLSHGYRVLPPPKLPPAPPVLTVAIWPLFEHNMSTAAELQLEFDGIHESSFLRMAPTSSFQDHFFSDGSLLAENLVWVGDTGAQSIEWSGFCAGMDGLVQKAQAVRARHGMTVQWPVIVFDWTDSASTRQRCKNLELTIGREFVWYTKRSIVVRRQWNTTAQWQDTGGLADLSVGTEGSMHMRYQHAPLAVRTDTVAGLKAILQDEDFHLHFNLSTSAITTKYNDATPKLTLASPIVSILERPIDVIHLWPLTGRKGASSELRIRVSEIIHQYFGKENNHNHSYNSFVGVAGMLAKGGRQGVSNKYLEILLKTKIYVISQRALWEDHYRLFEGLVSGTMVLMDRMLSLPAGLKNGTSVVEYTSADDLVAKVVYYLEHPEEREAIATAGRSIAMSRHRSWHRVEDLIFGFPVTQCLPSVNPDCPFVVHANEGLYPPSENAHDERHR
jgi:Glycosyl transferases group 1